MFASVRIIRGGSHGSVHDMYPKFGMGTDLAQACVFMSLRRYPYLSSAPWILIRSGISFLYAPKGSRPVDEEVPLTADKSVQPQDVQEGVS